MDQRAKELCHHPRVSTIATDERYGRFRMGIIVATLVRGLSWQQGN